VLRYLTNGLAVRWLGWTSPTARYRQCRRVVPHRLVQALAEEAAVLRSRRGCFLSVGVMGGFTTYSAVLFETVRLVELDAWGRALANVM